LPRVSARKQILRYCRCTMYKREQIFIDEVKWNKAVYDTMEWETTKYPIWDSEIEIKQENMKEIDKSKLEITKEGFEALLKKACETKPKPLPKRSKT
jgi:hypothetical protein